MRVEKDSVKSMNNKAFGEVTRKQPHLPKKQNVSMFMSIFIVLLIVFLGFAKMLSPDIDITLGDDSYNSQEEDNLREVDSRLKALQAEDDGMLSEEDAALIEEDGYVLIPKGREASSEPAENMPAENEPNVTETVNPDAHADSPVHVSGPSEPVQAPVAAPVVSVPVAPTLKTYRVYVGMYSSQSQAEVARGILQDAGLGVAPNIKQIGGGYTLQVGAFNSKDAASALANKLLMNNYPARVSSD